MKKVLVISAAWLLLFLAISATSEPPSRPPPLSFRVDSVDDPTDDMGPSFGKPERTSFHGRDREYGLFGSDDTEDPNAGNPSALPKRHYRAGGRARPAGVPPGGAAATDPRFQDDTGVSKGIRGWLEGNRDKFPGLKVRADPQTTLKLRKRFRPLRTVLTLGADFNTQLGVWQFKSSWEDSLIGGRLTLNGRELQLSKTWLLSVGAVEDLVTRLRLRAAVDMTTGKAYARFGFRTERLTPINVVEGFTLKKMFPLDGSAGHASLEVKANFAFPEPEIEYSTDNKKSLVGMGDIEVAVEELNLVLDY